MSRVSRRSLLLAAAGLLSACSAPETPLARLEATVVSLQTALEEKNTSAVMDLLDERFRAQETFDADWARKTMALVFLRFAQVRVLAVSSRSSLEDGEGGTLGLTEARVLVTGAQGLVPERLEPYVVTMRWRREGNDWKLRDLVWE